MDCLQVFIFDQSRHEVNVFEINDELWMRASQICAVLGLQNHRNATENLDGDERSVISMPTAGGKQDCVMLSQLGVYRLIMRSNKPIAKPFQKWVLRMIKTVESEGHYNLKADLDNQVSQLTKYKEMLASAKSELDTKSLLNAALQQQLGNIEQDHHCRLLETYHDKPVVYFGRVLATDSTALVKIGASAGLRERVNNLKSEYGGFVLLKVFAVQRLFDFERFLHGHEDIRKHQYHDLVLQGKKCVEVFLFDRNTLEKAYNIAARNVKKFDSNMDTLLHRKTHQLLKAACENTDAMIEDAVAEGTNIINANLTEKTESLKTVVETGSEEMQNMIVCRTDTLQKAVQNNTAIMRDTQNVVCSISQDVKDMQNMFRLMQTTVNTLQNGSDTARSDTSVLAIMEQNSSIVEQQKECTSVQPLLAAAFTTPFEQLLPQQRTMVEKTCKELKRAHDLLTKKNVNRFDIICALALTTGLGTIELFKADMIKVDEYTAVLRGGGRVWDRKAKDDYEVRLLAPFDIISSKMDWVQTVSETRDMDNKAINLKYSSSINNHAKQWLGDDGKFHAFREMYRTTFARVIMEEQVAFSKAWRADAYAKKKGKKSLPKKQTITKK